MLWSISNHHDHGRRNLSVWCCSTPFHYYSKTIHQYSLSAAFLTMSHSDKRHAITTHYHIFELIHLTKITVVDLNILSWLANESNWLEQDEYIKPHRIPSTIEDGNPVILNVVQCGTTWRLSLWEWSKNAAAQTILVDGFSLVVVEGCAAAPDREISAAVIVWVC